MPFFWSQHYDVADQLCRPRREMGRNRDRRRHRGQGLPAAVQARWAPARRRLDLPRCCKPAGRSRDGAHRRLGRRPAADGRRAKTRPCSARRLRLHSARRRSSYLTSLRRGGRVVECTALEMRHTGNRIGGSNPSLSATFDPCAVRRMGLKWVRDSNPRFIPHLAAVFDRARCEKNALAKESALGSNPSLSVGCLPKLRWSVGRPYRMWYLYFLELRNGDL